MSSKTLSKRHVQRVVSQPAAREVVPAHAGESFRWMEHGYPAPIARWNYHPEVEIHLIRKGTGSYIIGNQVGTFAAGHVAMVGAGVPHDWMSDLEPGEVIEDRDAVVQFTPSWLEQTVAAVPELHRALDLMRESRRGIVYSGATAVAAAREIEGIGVTDGPQRVAHFFSLMDIFVRAPEEEYHFVAHELYSFSVGREERTAVDAGLAYVLENFNGNVRMSEAARLAHMSEPTFSKYFKRASGLTFSHLVRRLRIGNACRLLTLTDTSVAEISSSVGYSNLANFNRQFRAETGMTPSEFRRVGTEVAPSGRPLGILGVPPGAVGVESLALRTGMN